MVFCTLGPHLEKNVKTVAYKTSRHTYLLQLLHLQSTHVVCTFVSW